MLYLLVIAGLVAAISVLVMSGAVTGAAPLVTEFAAVMFAISAGISTLAITALEG